MAGITAAAEAAENAGSAGKWRRTALKMALLKINAQAEMIKNRNAAILIGPCVLNVHR